MDYRIDDASSTLDAKMDFSYKSLSNSINRLESYTKNNFAQILNGNG